MTGHAALAQMVKHEGHGSAVLATVRQTKKLGLGCDGDNLSVGALAPDLHTKGVARSINTVFIKYPYSLFKCIYRTIPA